MPIENSSSVSRAQLRGARAMLGLSADRLAEKAKVHRRTIRAIERGDVEPQRGTAERIARALESLGVEFLSDHAVRLKCQTGI